MSKPTDVPESTKLLPCPFCGGDVRFQPSHVLGEGGHIFHVNLFGGCVYTSGALSVDDNGALIAAWNQRTPAASPVAPTESLERK